MSITKGINIQWSEALRKEKIFNYLYVNYRIVLIYFISTVLLFAGISKIIEPETLLENLSLTFVFLPVFNIYNILNGINSVENGIKEEISIVSMV